MTKDRSERRPAAQPSRRRVLRLIAAGGLAWLPVLVRPRGGVAQIVDWSADDAARYADIRKAFDEYSDISDREFAARMETLFRTLDRNPDADVIVAEVSRRLPSYRDVPRARMKRDLAGLFRRARQHFERP